MPTPSENDILKAEIDVLKKRVAELEAQLNARQPDSSFFASAVLSGFPATQQQPAPEPQPLPPIPVDGFIRKE